MNEHLFRLINTGIKNGFLDSVLPIFSSREYFILPGAFLFILLCFFGKRATRACMLALIIAMAIGDRGSENALKNLFQERRPYATLQNVNLHRGDAWILSNPDPTDEKASRSNSFPSTHATNVATIAAVLAFVNRKTLLATIPLALLVGLSRIYTGNHYPADVLAGYAFGAFCGTLVTSITLLLARKIWAKRPEEDFPPPMPQDRVTFLWILAIWAFINFTFVHFNHFSLAEDEAQYWDWSRHFSLGYYSKPPMIAYFIRVLTRSMGHTEWAIRSGAVACSLGTLALIYALTLRITKRERAALTAACITIAMPFTWAGSVLMTIDPLLVFFWALSMYAFHRAVNGEPAMWLLTGFALGCGMLSKYTIALLLLSFVLYLLLVDRRHLRTFGPYAALAVTALCLSGVIYWNATNDWVSIRHTASIGAAVSRSFGKILNRFFVQYFRAQAGIASPILFAFMIWAMIAMARRWRQSRDAAFLFLCGAVLFLFYAYVSLTHRPEPNWPVCSYLAAIPALAWIWTERQRAPRMRKLLAAGVILGCLMGMAIRSTNLVYLLSDIVGGSGNKPDRIQLGPLSIDPDRDPTNRLIGGRELGQALAKYGSESENLFIFTPRYQLTAWAAFYTPGNPRTYYANPEERYNQYDLWGGWEKLVGKNALFITGGDETFATSLVGEFVSRGAFARGEFLETIRIFRGKTLIKAYSIIKLYNYSGYAWTKENEKF